MTKAFASSNRAFWTTMIALIFLLLPHPSGAGQATAPSLADIPAPQSKGDAGAAWSFSLDYTGELYGYYRIEPSGAAELGPVKKFPKHNGTHGPLLLGMGDNFGPELGASVQREFLEDDLCKLPVDDTLRGRDILPPEILYKDENRLPNLAECDNVGRFLMWAGYSAIVPGKEDFLYSARWLRRMAVLFQGASSLPGGSFPDGGKGYEQWKKSYLDKHGAENRKPMADHGPLMLAANLRVNFGAEAKRMGLNLPANIEKQKLGEQPKDSGNSICPLLFRWDLLGSPPEACVSGGAEGDTVTTQMDWLRRLDLTLDDNPDCDPKFDGPDCLATSMNLQARKETSFRKQLLENQAKIILAALSLGPEDKLKALKAALEVLAGVAKDKPFQETNGESAPLVLTTTGKDAIKGLKEWTGEKCGETGKQDDLYRVVCALEGVFDPVSNAATQTNVDFLFAPDVRKAAIRLLLGVIADQQRNVGYTIVNGTLVIGVVGQETMKAVSPANLEICTKWTTQLSKAARTNDLDLCEELEDYKEPSETTRSQGGVHGGGPWLIKARLFGKVKVGDPVFAVTSLVRAAWERKNVNEFDHVVVMAQMPRTEAEELAARVLTNLSKTNRQLGPATADLNAGEDAFGRNKPHVDLIVSEAQIGHWSSELEVHYAHGAAIPLLTPRPAWYINQERDGLVGPVSSATVTLAQNEGSRDRILTNHKPPEDQPSQEKEKPRLLTMAEVLDRQLRALALQKPSVDLANLQNFWNSCEGGKACEDAVMMQYLLVQLHRSSHADVVLVEYRDFYFGRLLGAYGKDDICEVWLKDHPQAEAPGVADPLAYCKLHVALDRVLWKGDLSERVMVDGKTLKSLLARAQQETDEEQSLAARDTVNEWLMTFGIVTELPKNLSAASMGPATFTVPGVTLCKNDQKDAEGPQYCINGKWIADDGAYWVASSDHLARDKQLYKELSGLDPRYHLKKPGLFLTREITDEVYVHSSKGTSEALAGAPDAQIGMREIETYHQKRPILQLDYAKAVAGFMIRKPDISNTQLGTDFSGVADSRATTPSAQEVDFEAVERLTRGLGARNFWQYLKVGIQSDLEYDRAVTGNITGSQTVTYALNSFTTGGFLQVRLNGDHPSRRLYLVVAPYQYQQQLTGNYLFFKFTTPPGQITVPTPAWNGFVQRLGARYEFGGNFTGSYIETGPEYSEIHSVLSGLVLPDGTVCPVSEGSFSSCFAKNGLVITSGTVLKPLTETVHSGGWYWDVHIQRALDKGKHSSFTIETKGDNYAWPGATLPTQSRYAFTTTGALNFAVIGNLAFSPTFTTFFYSNQGAPANPSHSLVTNSFSVTAKWYFARDAAVPFWQQMWFRGPASLDQTRSAKMK